MDPNFEKQLRNLKTHANNQYEARKAGGQIKWYRPLGWSGNPTDFDGMSEPFIREQINETLVSAISDPKSPGTTGDVIICSIMLNYLSVLERSLRVRHTLRRPRATAHAMSRDRGQGNDSGPFIQLGVEYVRSLLKQSKKAQ